MYTTWLEISRFAIKHNLKQFRKIIGPNIKLMAVVKSNAYGHGMIEVVIIALNNGTDWLGVVNLDEALKLRRAKIKAPILILSYFPFEDSKQIREAIKNEIDLPIYNLKIAKLLSKIASKIGKSAKTHIKVDTGTSRLGVLVKDALDFIRKVRQLPNLETRGIFTHYASSEEQDQTFTNKQTEEFRKLLDGLRQENIEIPLAHTACSAACIINPQTHSDMVRIGISFYGLWPSQDTKRLAQKVRPEFNLKPVLTWKTRIIQIKDLPEGTTVGYGCTYEVKRPTRLAVLPCGYYEGYDRLLSNKGEVLIKGKRCKVLGRVCMNLTMVDVTDITDVKVGDEVILIGKQGREEITAEEIAEKIETINYEVVSRINPNLLRIYV